MVGFVRLQGGQRPALDGNPLGSPTSSSSARRWSAASRRTASARATSASPTAARTPSAARPMSAAPSRCSSRSAGIPRDLGLKGAVFADAGTLFGYHGRRTFNVNGDSFINGVAPGGACSFNAFTLGVEPECVNVHDSATIRSSIGASILWNSPLGPIRFDYAYALTKDEGVSTCRARTSASARIRPRRSASPAARASKKESRAPAGSVPAGALSACPIPSSSPTALQPQPRRQSPGCRPAVPPGRCRSGPCLTGAAPLESAGPA